MNEEERIREEMAEVIDMAMCFGRASVDEVWKSGYKEAKQGYIKLILSIKGIRIEVDNQDLPENEDIPKEFNELACGAEDDSDNVARACYLLAQQDMLTPKDGKVWVKCKVKEE